MMKIREIYYKAIKRGIELDPRGRGEVGRELASLKKEYGELSDKKKKGFDTERLTNPYSDTRILVGDPETSVKRALVGIDIEVGEIMLADRLSQGKKPIDLVIAHHPEGRAMATLHEVMDMQSGILKNFGVPINVAEGIMSERIDEVERKLMPVNHTRALDAARLLGMPLMCIHTPSDNAVQDYLQGLFDEKKPHDVSDVIDMLREIPEYAAALDETIAPKVVSGDAKRTAGKVFVDMTGGTGGSKLAYEKLATAGVGTVVGMHIGEDHRKEAARHHINVVIAGHIASDNLGLNLLFDHILEGVEVVACSGFRRIERGRAVHKAKKSRG
jgi:putative NIF3 family GTP cyclohydrolase 1 type 2